MEKNENTFTEKVESILDELFAEDDETAETVEESAHVGYYPLRFLKATVLSIDWEITDEVMGRFIDQVERLKEAHQEDKTILPLLQMLGSTGQHIRIFKENAHPTALKVLKSLYLSLEKVMSETAPSEVEKSRLLFREIRKFKALKAQIVEGNLALANRVKPAVVQAASPVEETAPVVTTSDDGDGNAILAAIAELKQFVETEIRQLREEIQSLRTSA
ncbi:MAG: hypothetical protein QNJ22_00440 [Desulfosarcinaceae bacterium]|nr:hypothetical protein [Desulfosarcinaceae bacterium]